METRVSEFVQPTGKMKNRKNWTFATLWLMEKVDVWWNGGSSQFFSRIGSDGSQSCWLRERREFFPRGSPGDWKTCSDLHRRRQERGLNTALRLLTDDLNAVLEATTVRRP